MSYRNGVSRHRPGHRPFRSPPTAGRDTVGKRDQFPTVALFGLGLAALVLLK